jgi:hypothetical protein
MATLLLTKTFDQPASEDQLTKTVEALQSNGFRSVVVETGAEARTFVLGLIPSGAEVYNPPSRTLDQIGLTAEIETSTRFTPLRSRLKSLDRKTQRREINKLTASPDVVVGSVHAITQQGQVLIASATGSQLSSEVSGAAAVIWVVGIQKLVSDLDEGFRRIREYSYPLEDARTRRLYAQPSAINKILLINAEQPGRITIVLVRQNLGF